MIRGDDCVNLEMFSWEGGARLDIMFHDWLRLRSSLLVSLRALNGSQNSRNLIGSARRQEAIIYTFTTMSNRLSASLCPNGLRVWDVRM